MSWEKAASRSGVIIARVSTWTAIRSREACARSRSALSAVNPFLQVGVKIDDAILDRAIEPIELFISDSQLSF